MESCETFVQSEAEKKKHKSKFGVFVGGYCGLVGCSFQCVLQISGLVKLLSSLMLVKTVKTCSHYR